MKHCLYNTVMFLPLKGKNRQGDLGSLSLYISLIGQVHMLTFSKRHFVGWLVQNSGTNLSKVLKDEWKAKV